MELFLEEKDADDWIYRGEGALNLALVCSGSSPAFSGKIIRVQKVPRNGSMYEIGCTVLTKYECILWKDAVAIVASPNKGTADQYVQCVMIPLLGSEFVEPGIRVNVSRGFLESVKRNVLSQRPGWRVKAAQVDCCADSVLLMSDHSVFPHSISKGSSCISVEIKIQQVSEYDPLDLFSGLKERIHRAINDLFANPQNNLRVFLNGSLIFGGLEGGKHGTHFGKAEAFEDYLKYLIHEENGLHIRSFVHLVGEAIVKLGVLDRLLEVQRLDKLDVEGAIHAYYDIVSQPCKICRISGENWNIGKYSSLHSIPLDESLKIVRDYLTAATAKDSSLMITFRPREDDEPESHHRTIYLDSTKQRFDIKAYFIDLDMKPLKKMEHYYELDQKIVDCYKQMVKVDHEGGITTTIEGYETGYSDCI